MISIDADQISKSFSVFISKSDFYKKENQRRMIRAACVGDDFIIESNKRGLKTGKQYDYVIYTSNDIFILPKKIFENNFERIKTNEMTRH